jgi:hypothetical protein
MDLVRLPCPIQLKLYYKYVSYLYELVRRTPQLATSEKDFARISLTVVRGHVHKVMRTDGLAQRESKRKVGPQGGKWICLQRCDGRRCFQERRCQEGRRYAPPHHALWPTSTVWKCERQTDLPSLWPARAILCGHARRGQSCAWDRHAFRGSTLHFFATRVKSLVLCFVMNVCVSE